MQLISVQKNLRIYSENLGREVVYDIVLPATQGSPSVPHKILLMNDGQDFNALQMEQTLRQLYQNNEVHPFILAAIHTNENRLNEYGTSAMADYKNRGNRARDYEQFIIHEFLPHARNTWNTSANPADNFFCGFSLGGLSAIDIVWNNPLVFSKSGVFSGSFWWRRKAYEEGYEDNDRIMHMIVRNGQHNHGQKFWFECGTNDEKEDRNGNGIIDSIEDTLDLITELERHGYKRDIEVIYHEIEGGEHNPHTWSKAMPVFLKWLVGKKP